jgi:ComF family protein
VIGAIRSAIFESWSVLFPQVCIACLKCLGPSTDAPVCAECTDELVIIPLDSCCGHCGAPDLAPIPGKVPRCENCIRLPDSFKGALSAFPYDSPAGAMVRRLKYQNLECAARWLAEFSRPAADPFISERARPDIVVPVPITFMREMNRGFNQAEELAEAFAKVYGIAHERHALRRAKRTPPQARMASIADRIRNVSGAFHVVDKEAVAGKRALLIDDVMTTGATAASAAAALLEGGASAVYVFTPARGGARAK